MKDLVLIRRTRVEALRMMLRAVVVDLRAGREPEFVALQAEVALHIDDERAATEEIP